MQFHLHTLAGSKHNITYHNITFHNIIYHNITYHSITYHNITYHRKMLEKTPPRGKMLQNA